MAVCHAKATMGKHTLLSYALKELSEQAKLGRPACSSTGAGDEVEGGGDGRRASGACAAVEHVMGTTAVVGAAEAAVVASRALEALQLEATLPNVREGSRASLAELQGQLSVLARDVADVAKVADEEPEAAAHLKRDPFKEQMTKFAADA